MKLITLTQVDSRASRYNQHDDDEGEDDGVARSNEPTRKVVVNADAIRSFTARRTGSGTRLTFVDRGGFSVTEEVDEVARLINVGIVRGTA